MNDVTHDSLFIWGGTKYGVDFGGTLYRKCVWCGANRIYSRGDQDYDDNTHQYAYCPLCGWRGERLIKYYRDYSPPKYSYHQRCIKEFENINASDLSLSEIGTFLKRSFSNIYSLDWRRFEELIEDVLKQHGYSTILTKRSRDDGADIVILSNGKNDAIVECKKFAHDRKVGIEIVRSLVGACVEWEVRKAYLVTTSGFSSVAIDKRKVYNSRGYELDLVDASELLTYLQIYNDQHVLLPLHQLDENARRDIIEANTREIYDEIRSSSLESLIDME